MNCPASTRRRTSTLGVDSIICQRRLDLLRADVVVLLNFSRGCALFHEIRNVPNRDPRALEDRLAVENVAALLDMLFPRAFKLLKALKKVRPESLDRKDKMIAFRLALPCRRSG